MILFFSVPGEPKGKGRPRFSKNGHAYTPKDTVNYQNEVRFEFAKQCGGKRFSEESAIKMDIEAFYKVPQRDSKKTRSDKLNGVMRPTKKPDMDNIVKVIADALNTVAYHDDTQIVECSVKKFYDEEPRVEIRMTDVGLKDVKNAPKENA